MRIRHRDIVQRLSEKKGGAPPATTYYPFWVIVPAGAADLTIKVVTTDGNPIDISYGDGAIVTLTSNTNDTHSYAGAGTYQIGFAEPDRVQQIIGGGTPEALGGGIDLSIGGATPLLANLTTLTLSGYSITGLENLSLSPLVESLNLNSNLLDATAIDNLLVALNANGVINGSLDYGLNTGSADLDRSPEAILAKTELSGKGWLIVS